jgi:hypothetical protein
MSDFDEAPEIPEAEEAPETVYHGPTVNRPIPAGWGGAKEAPRAVAAPRVPLRFAHMPLGALPKVTADWYDPDRTKYPTRGDIPSVHTEVTPVKFHPAELPDPAVAFAAKMYPQVIPSHQIDPRHETHSLSESVPVTSPVRARNRK